MAIIGVALSGAPMTVYGQQEIVKDLIALRVDRQHEPLLFDAQVTAVEGARVHRAPTGAKGLDLAVRDVRVLAPALAALVPHDDDRLAERYSERCLRHVWWAQYFSCWLTRLVHASDDPVERRLADAELRPVVDSLAARTLLAENYVGRSRALAPVAG